MKQASWLAGGWQVLGLGLGAGAGDIAAGSAAVRPFRRTADVLLVVPGEVGTNGDVTVTNRSTSGATAKIDPGKGSEHHESTVTTGKRFAGTISGIGGGDTVLLGVEQADVTLLGEGGRIKIRSGSRVRLRHTGRRSSAPITVVTPDTTLLVHPGSLIAVQT